MNLLRTNYGSKEGEYAEVKAKHALLELRPMLVISKPRKKPDPNDAPTLIKIKKCSYFVTLNTQILFNSPFFLIKIRHRMHTIHKPE